MPHGDEPLKVRTVRDHLALNLLDLLFVTISLLKTNTKSWISVILLVSVALVGGCETASKVTNIFSKSIILPCPDYRILAVAANYTAYKEGPGRDLTDVDFEGKYNNMRLGCLTKMDKETKIGTMEVDITLDFIAQRGPANKTRKATFPYFISVTDLNNKILYREEFKVSVSFAGNRTGLGFRNDPVTLELDLKPGRTGENYIVFTGFIVTPEQLKNNRARRRSVTQ